MERQEERSLLEQVSEAPIDHILKQKLRKRNRLPNGFFLAQMLCVERKTMGETVKILESKNIVAMKHKVGTFVSKEYRISDDPLGLCLIEDREGTVKGIMDICVVIEPGITAVAARCVEEEDVKELERCCQEAGQYIRCSQNHVECDISSRTQITVCSKNRITTSLTPIITSLARIFFRPADCNYPEDTVRWKLGGGEVQRDH